MDFEKWPTYLPVQLKSVKIIEETKNGTTIEEILVFKTLIKNEIKQTSIYKKISDNSIHSEIISGHAKGTKTNISFRETKSGVEVSVDIELKLSLFFIKDDLKKGNKYQSIPKLLIKLNLFHFIKILIYYLIIT